MPTLEIAARGLWMERKYKNMPHMTIFSDCRRFSVPLFENMLIYHIAKKYVHLAAKSDD